MTSEECRSHGQTCQATPQASAREAASEWGLDVALGGGACMTGLPNAPACSSLRISETMIEPRRSSGSTFFQVRKHWCQSQVGVVKLSLKILYKVEFYHEQSWKHSQRSELSCNKHLSHRLCFIGPRLNLGYWVEWHDWLVGYITAPALREL